MKLNGVWFMVLKDAKLPGAEGIGTHVNGPADSNVSWPLAGGMYPTHLNSQAHHHRSKWTSFHGLSVPKLFESGSDVKAAQPLIGSALVGFPSFKFVVNGTEVNVRNA